MEFSEVVNIILPIVFSCVGIALVVFVIELIKVVRVARGAIEDVTEQLDPMLKDAKQMTSDLTPAAAKIDPLMDRALLTMDGVNLEMMRVDGILEDVAEITDTAASATNAVENITNAPVKAVSNMASRFRSAFGGKSASDEAAQLAEQREAVAAALEDYRKAESEGAGETAPAASAAPAPAEAARPARQAAVNPIDEGSPVPGSDPVIDPKAIEETSFFDDEANGQ